MSPDLPCSGRSDRVLSLQDVTRYPEYLMQRTWRVGSRIALVKHHGRQVVMPSQVHLSTTVIDSVQ